MAEFLKDEEAAERKYKDMTLKITGVVRKEYDVPKLVARVGDEEWLISTLGLLRTGVRPGDRVTVLACGLRFIPPYQDEKATLNISIDRPIAVSR